MNSKCYADNALDAGQGRNKNKNDTLTAEDPKQRKKSNNMILGSYLDNLYKKHRKLKNTKNQKDSKYITIIPSSERLKTRSN